MKPSRGRLSQRLAHQLAHAGVVKQRRNTTRVDKHCGPAPKNEGLRVVYLKAVAVDQGYRKRPEWSLSLKRPQGPLELRGFHEHTSRVARIHVTRFIVPEQESVEQTDTDERARPPGTRLDCTRKHCDGPGYGGAGQDGVARRSGLPLVLALRATDGEGLRVTSRLSRRAHRRGHFRSRRCDALHAPLGPAHEYRLCQHE
jgi:hypothetical protein